jgi:hypothetical protein
MPRSKLWTTRENLVMRRNVMLAVVAAAAISLTTATFAEAVVAEANGTSASAKRHAAKRSAGKRRNGYGPYGFLPGVRSPEYIAAQRRATRDPGFGWYGSHYYGYPVGVAGFYHGQWNGGSFGPCWTRTPMGMVWNCGR